MTMKTSDESYILPLNLSISTLPEDLEKYKKYMTPDNKPEWFGDFLKEGIEPRTDDKGEIIQRMMSVKELIDIRKKSQKIFKSGDQLFRAISAEELSSLTKSLKSIGYNLRDKGILILYIEEKRLPKELKGNGDITVIWAGNTTLTAAHANHMLELPVTEYQTNGSFKSADLGGVGLKANDGIRIPVASGAKPEDVEKVLRNKVDSISLVWTEVGKVDFNNQLEIWAQEYCKDQPRIKASQIDKIVKSVYEAARWKVQPRHNVYVVPQRTSTDFWDEIRNPIYGKDKNGKTVEIRKGYLDTPREKFLWSKSDTYAITKMWMRRWESITQPIVNQCVHFGDDINHVDPMKSIVDSFEELKDVYDNFLKFTDCPKIGINYPYITPNGKSFYISHIMVQAEDFSKYGLTPNEITTIGEFQEAVDKYYEDQENKQKSSDSEDESDEEFDPEYVTPSLFNLDNKSTIN